MEEVVARLVLTVRVAVAAMRIPGIYQLLQAARGVAGLPLVQGKALAVLEL
jgi:hypothetical protein